MAALKARLRAQVGHLTIRTSEDSPSDNYDLPPTPKINLKALETLKRLEHPAGSTGYIIDRLLSPMLFPLTLQSIETIQKTFILLNKLRS
jgi:hypothetical protein